MVGRPARRRQNISHEPRLRSFTSTVNAQYLTVKSFIKPKMPPENEVTSINLKYAQTISG
jgi:hypothetical protein